MTCVPCEMQMTADQKDAHSKSGHHRVALLKRWYATERGMIPLEGGFSFARDSQEFGAFTELMRRAGVPHVEDAVNVEFSTDADGNWMEQPATTGLYVPEWVQQLWTAGIGQFQFAALLFELATEPDPQHVATAVAAMIAHNKRMNGG